MIGGAVVAWVVLLASASMACCQPHVFCMTLKEENLSHPCFFGEEERKDLASGKLWYRIDLVPRKQYEASLKSYVDDKHRQHEALLQKAIKQQMVVGGIGLLSMICGGWRMRNLFFRDTLDSREINAAAKIAVAGVACSAYALHGIWRARRLKLPTSEKATQDHVRYGIINVSSLVMLCLNTEDKNKQGKQEKTLSEHLLGGSHLAVLGDVIKNTAGVFKAEGYSEALKNSLLFESKDHHRRLFVLPPGEKDQRWIADNATISLVQQEGAS